jgi:hypothetical protein
MAGGFRIVREPSTREVTDTATPNMDKARTNRPDPHFQASRTSVRRPNIRSDKDKQSEARFYSKTCQTGFRSEDCLVLQSFFARDVRPREHFQAKWIPVRRQKMRSDKEKVKFRQQRKRPGNEGPAFVIS